ncbi:MAG TPA: YggS family pyridoxal phosphate-dependent enzyme [Tepidisphaeraceae bacterium]|nr:YggS family pyridoxal phosphate-dependent enzyme [Tepidisphaeraceae bacterium]
MAKKSALADKLHQVQDRIAKACSKAKRDPSEVTLIAVTKTAAPEQIREIVQLGVGNLGENRVQPLAQRAMQINEFHQRRVTQGDPEVAGKLRWHMIGHLQRNKVKQILPIVSLIHSVDSLRLAEELETAGAKAEKRIAVLMQINASEEVQKHGVAVGASVHLAEQIDSMPHLQLIGLMSMAPLTEDEKVIQHCFSRTREIFDEMKWHKIGAMGFKHLSMGMSHDFEIAVAEGATMLRIGSALFGGKVHDHEEGEE